MAIFLKKTGSKKSLFKDWDDIINFKKLVLGCSIVILIMFLMVLLFVGIFFFASKKDPENNQELSQGSSEVKDFDEDEDGRKEFDTGSDFGDEDTKEGPGENNVDFPLDLPDDSPFQYSEIDALYQGALERINMFYRYDSDDDFEKKAKPYVQLYMASSQYVYDKYDLIFRGDNPNLEMREDTMLTILEDCEDYATGLSKASCDGFLMLAGVDPISGDTRFYINFEHDKFEETIVEYIIDMATHETIHLLQFSYIEGTNKTPTWYEESMATGLQHTAPARKDYYKDIYEKFGVPQSFKELEEWYKSELDTPADKGRFHSAYYAGMLYFDYILERTTLEKYVQLISSNETLIQLEEHSQLDEDFKDLTGKYPEDLYQEFLEESF